MARSFSDIQDELLIFRCQDGEHEALGELFERWQGRLFAHAYRLTGQSEEAADAVQEAWLAIVRGIRRLDDPTRFRPWAYRIVTNKAVDRLRRAKKQRRVLNTIASRPETDAVDSKLEHDDDISALRVALLQMSGDRRAILTMFYIESMALSDIADSLGVPVGTVKSRLHHARATLKKTLETNETTSERKSHVQL